MIRLREAVERGDFYAVQIEIAQGVDVDACGPVSALPCHASCRAAGPFMPSSPQLKTAALR